MVTAGEKKATGNHFFLIYPGNTSMITYTISENPVSEDEAPRSDDTYNTGEELVTDVITAIDNSSSNEATGINPPVVPLVDVVSDRLQYTSFNKKKINIATWNVRSMYEGKLNLVKNEMEKMNLSILGISEMKWKGRGYFQSEGYRVFFSGHDTTRKNSVAFICNKKICKSVLGYNPISDRIISIRQQGKPVNITLVQIYAPILDAEDDEIDEFYNMLQKVTDSISNSDVKIIMGDWNAKVGSYKISRITGQWGLGERNEGGDKLLDFCAGNDMVIMNTVFKQPKRRLYTWTSPGGQYKNQIDYMLCSGRWRSTFSSVKTMLGADCGSDHELLLGKIKIRLKSIKKQLRNPRFDVSCITHHYEVEVKNRFAILTKFNKQPDDLWNDIKQNVLVAAEERLHKVTRKKRTPWLSEQAVQLAEKRRKIKVLEHNSEKYRQLSAEFRRKAREDKDKYLKVDAKKLKIIA